MDYTSYIGYRDQNNPAYVWSGDKWVWQPLPDFQAHHGERGDRDDRSDRGGHGDRGDRYTDDHRRDRYYDDYDSDAYGPEDDDYEDDDDSMRLGSEGDDAGKPSTDLNDPMSAFQPTIKTSTRHVQESDFAKEQWFAMRGLDKSGKFLDESADWFKFSKADRLIRQFASPSFTSSTMEEALPVPSTSVFSKMDKNLASTQKMFGAVAHVALQGQENFNGTYLELLAFVDKLIKGQPEEGDKDPQKAWDSIRSRLINDVSKNISQVVRVACHGYNDSLYNRRKNVLDNMARSKSTLAVKRLQNLPPSTRYLFGNDITKIKDSLKMTNALRYDGKEFNKVHFC